MGIGSLTSSDTSDFNTYGPSHLKSPDWTNPHYQTGVLSSLVNGVYTLERDRRLKQKKRYRLGLRKCPEPQADPWWEFFNFELMKQLTDDDSSIYGAVFEYKSYSVYQNNPHVKVPQYVMAFRGTVLNSKTLICDFGLVLQCMLNTLHRGGRPKHAFEEIRHVVDKHSDSVIWLAGHSSGAALALIAGKTMMRSGCFLESHIFNPPFSSIPIEQIPGGSLFKHVFQTAKSVVKGTIGAIVNLPQNREDKSKAASWIPHLYVNPKDPICSGYMHYLERRSAFSRIGADGIEKLAASISYASELVGKFIGSSPSDLSKEPLYVLPSADMTVNKSEPTKSTPPHGLHQWWERDPAVRENWESCCIRSYRLKQLTL